MPSYLLTRIARPTDRVKPRDPLLQRGQRRKRRVRLRLVPVSYGREIVGAMVTMAVLDGRPERFGEGDRRVKVKAVHGGTATRELRSFNRRSIQPIRKRPSRKAPRAQRIVF